MILIQYTRRNFEIPATGTLMLSEYTPELASMYTPGVEADFFTDKDELVTKVELYLSDDLLRERVGKAGLKRVTESGAEVTDRCREILSRITVDHN